MLFTNYDSFSFYITEVLNDGPGRQKITSINIRKEFIRMSTKVRYAGSGGLNVRNAAAGTKTSTLNEGDLMYDISGVSTVTKPLNGTSYVWVKVHFYKSDTQEEGDGWVTQSNTKTVSTSVPDKSKVYSSNLPLKQYQMLTNARYIYKYLKNQSWTKNAIYAILGNMEAESYINPGKWERTNDTSGGYGLTQWTPTTKLTDWLNGAAKSDIDNQLKRILYEVSRNNEQWDSAKHSPSMSFSDFTSSTKNCKELAEYFVRCYENPRNVETKVSARKKNAAKWKAIIDCLL